MTRLKLSAYAGIEASMVRAAALLVILGALAAHPQVRPNVGKAIDVQRSTITLHVERAGFFSFAGDNHEVRAPILSGSIIETEMEASGRVNETSGRTNEGMDKREVELVVDAAHMQVLDPSASSDTRAKVQAKMLGPDVLDVARFPRIEFRSRTVTPLNGARLKNPGDMLLRISGDLTLHGQTHPVEFEATGSSGHYRGSAKLKQSDFGIKPITIAGGAVKVKDEVKLDFEIFTQ